MPKKSAFGVLEKIRKGAIIEKNAQIAFTVKYTIAAMKSDVDITSEHASIVNEFMNGLRSEHDDPRVMSVSLAGWLNSLS